MFKKIIIVCELAKYRLFFVRIALVVFNEILHMKFEKKLFMSAKYASKARYEMLWYLKCDWR